MHTLLRFVNSIHCYIAKIVIGVDVYPIDGIPLLSGGALWPNTGVTWPDIALLPKPTLDLPRLLPPIFLVKFKFAIANWYSMQHSLACRSRVETVQNAANHWHSSYVDLPAQKNTN